MKCTVCKEKAVFKVLRANASFCKEHYNEFIHKQVSSAVKKYKMLDKKDRIMVCVSGGKDSLVLWHILNYMGYDVSGMYIDLGIKGYSEQSKNKVIKFAEKFSLDYKIADLTAGGHPVIDVASKTHRTTCSVCGLIKRYYFNKESYEGGYDVVATGHNLDDESARLFGNILNWNMDHLGKMSPVLPAHGEAIKKKVKPLIKLSEQEVAVYAIINGIDYIQQECPESKGATSLAYKDALNGIEINSPGVMNFFYSKFLEDASPMFEEKLEEKGMTAGECSVCGMPSFSETCSFCTLITKVKAVK